MVDVVIFPPSRETEARAYAAWTDTNWPGEGAFAYVQQDPLGQWVTPWLGGSFTWNSELFPEPDGGPAMRAAGIVAAAPVRAGEE